MSRKDVKKRWQEKMIYEDDERSLEFIFVQSIRMEEFP